MTREDPSPPRPDDLAHQLAALSPEKRRLLEQRVRAAADSGDRIPKREGDEYSPLSFEQQRLWFLHQLDPETPVYNVHRAWELRGALDIHALGRALETIVTRHEILRSICEVVDEEPMQSTTGPVHPLSIVDLRGLSREGRERRSVQIIDEEARRPFDLARGPLMRQVLLRLSDESHILILTLHHIVCDGWSMGILHRELSVLYGALAAGEPSPLEDLPIQFSDYAFWQRDRWREGKLEDRLAYWRRQLADLSTLELPTDRPRPRAVSFRGSREPLHLPAGLTARLRTLAHEEQATLFIALLAGFKALLHRTTGQEDIVVGTPMANRGSRELEPVIGMVVNTLVMRTDLGGDPTFRELLRRVRDMSLEAGAHQDVPFGKLVEELQPERDIRRNPLFQVTFTLQNTADPSPSFSGLSTVPFVSGSTGLLPAGNRTSKFDLAVLLIESDAGAEGFLEYSTDLFDRGTIERMARRFESLLDPVAADPDGRISSLPLWADGEREGSNGEERVSIEVARDHCVHELVEARAEQIPDAVAVVFQDGQLSYRELDRRANQLARHLRKRGVRPGTLVGIDVEPSPELVVSLLGVLKAGGAYMPLDASRPRDELDQVIEDAPVELLLTDQVAASSQNLRGEGRPRQVHIVEDWPAIAKESPESPRRAVSSRDLACVICGPSRSTGRSGRVEIEHRSVVDFLESTALAPGMIVSDALLSATALSGDLSVLDLFLPLVTGARVILVSRDVLSDGAALLDRLRETRATMMHATPDTYRKMIDAGWERRLAVRLLCGGEPLSRELADALLARAHEVWSLQGETAAGATAVRVDAGG